MELNLISKDKKIVVIEFTDVTETIVHPLVEKLLDDSDVLLAAYKTGHPQLDRPKLTVKTKRISPETAIKKAAEDLEEEIKKLRMEFEKVVKGTTTKKAAPKKKAVEKPKGTQVKKPKKSEEKSGKVKSTKTTDTKKQTKKK